MKKIKLEWHTERRKVKDLVPCKNNPNINIGIGFKNLKKSLNQSGYAEIIVVDLDNTIVAGEHRWRALMEMGKAEEEIDVRIPNKKLSTEGSR